MNTYYILGTNWKNPSKAFLLLVGDEKTFLLGRILSNKSRNAVQIRYCLPDFSNVSLEVT